MKNYVLAIDWKARTDKSNLTYLRFQAKDSMDAVVKMGRVVNIYFDKLIRTSATSFSRSMFWDDVYCVNILTQTKKQELSNECTELGFTFYSDTRALSRIEEKLSVWENCQNIIDIELPFE